MTWFEIIALAVLLLGVGAGGFLVAQRPTFWAGLLTVGLKAAWPYLVRRMPAEQEQAWRDCIRRGGQWDHRTRRCKR